MDSFDLMVIRLLLDEIKMEQRILARESDERNHIERSTLAEVERLQLQVEQAKHDAEMAAQIGDSLNKEVVCLNYINHCTCSKNYFMRKKPVEYAGSIHQLESKF